ncbi:MAG: hypothetical protein VB108_02715 [Anaerolineaceae bacterium]|nr:hypothetical protein [Anaerolineaceae bacterium]
MNNLNPFTPNQAQNDPQGEHLPASAPSKEGLYRTQLPGSSSAGWTEEPPTLRCNRCNKPITPAEAVLTPTGYRCRECINAQQKVFDTTKGFDLPLAFLLAALVSFAGSWVVTYLGFLTIFLASGLGLLIFTLVNRLIKHRRNRKLKWVLGAGTLLGSLPPLLIFAGSFIGVGFKPNLSLALLPLVWQLVYSLLIASTSFAQAKL